MRRAFLVILCLFLLAGAVSADSGLSSLQNVTTVSEDGSCRVLLTLTLKLDELPQELYFPLPRQAIDISVNNGSARTRIFDGCRNVDLTRVIQTAGTHTLVLQYTIPDIIDNSGDTLKLRLDLISGFSLPVEKLEFNLTLPGAVSGNPSFSSTYHPQTADSFITCTVSGSTVSGSVTSALKDHETLTVTLPVTAEMFPQPISKQWAIGTEDILMIVLTVLAALYWLLTLRTSLPRNIRRTVAPAGLTAGEMGCCLTGSGVDFTLMVISWAQMGYILIHVDDNGRVMLHKRMEMGNERGEFEVSYFRRLFGSRRMVDGTGPRYADICRLASTKNPNARAYFTRRSGNPFLLRLMLTAVGLLGGISMVFSFSSDTAWRIILSILLAIPAMAASWCIQSAGKDLFLRWDSELWLAILCAAVWTALGILAGEAVVAVLVVLLQLLGGIAAAAGGIRTELGRQTRDEILALRRCMKKISRGEVLQILRSNPEYYHHMAPYALALGVDKAFARQFGSVRLPQCTYLTTGMDGHMTAREWSRFLRSTVAALDAQQKARPWEKLLRK
ncbi:MAG: DUF2207 family protein [Faecousia sp.]